MLINNNSLVYILILNYNSYLETIECYESIINRVEYSNYRVLIIDNKSTDESAEKLSSYFESKKNAEVIVNNVNYGYAHGNNVGLRNAIDNHADYVMIMNPDVRIYNDIVSILLQQFEMNNNVGMIGPGLYSENNENILEGCGSKIHRITAYTTSVIQDGTNINSLNNTIISCDYVGGMCIAIKTDTLKKIGFIPEEYFLFYEETEWCKIARKCGLKVLLDLNAKIYHKGSVSIDKASDGLLNLHYYYIYRNRILYQNRTENKLVYIIFVVYYLLEIIYERIKGHYPKEAFIGWWDGIRNFDRLGKIKNDDKELSV